MIILRRNFFIGIIFSFLLLTDYSSAVVRVSEVFYDAEGSDVGKEYIEVINTYSSDIDFTKYKISIGLEGSNHRVVEHPVNTGPKTLSSGEAAILTKEPEEFLALFPNYRGLIFDVALKNLPNSKGETILIKDPDLNIIYEVTYEDSDLSDEEHKSLHIDEEKNITIGNPTPGEVDGFNIDDTTPSTSTNNDGTDTGTSSGGGSSVSNSKFSKSLETVGYSIVSSPNLVFVGVPAKFSLKEVLENGVSRFPSAVWNMGDGTIVKGSEIVYTYKNAGTYLIVATTKDESIVEAEVHIYDLKFDIEKVDDNVISIKHNHKNKLDVSNWKIYSDKDIFTFPNNSFILPNSKANININFPIKENIYLETESGILITSTDFTKKIVNNKNEPQTSPAVPKLQEETKKSEEKSAEKQINTNNNTQEKNKNKKQTNKILLSILFFVLLLLIIFTPFIIFKNEIKNKK